MYLETALDSWPNSSLASWEIWRSRYLGNRYWRTQLSHAPCDIWTSLSLYWHWGLDALWASLVFSDTKESACNAGDLGSVSGLGRSPGGGNGNPLQYSCLRSSRDRGAWPATVCGSQTRTRLSYWACHAVVSILAVPTIMLYPSLLPSNLATKSSHQGRKEKDVNETSCNAKKGQP